MCSRAELATNPAASSGYSSLTAVFAAELLIATIISVAELAGHRDDDIDLMCVITIIGEGSGEHRVCSPDSDIRELRVGYPHAARRARSRVRVVSHEL